MRVATFNLLHGRSLIDGTVEADRLATAVRSLDASVLALQEVDRDQPRSGFVDQTRIAAEALGAVESRFVAAVAGTPGERWTPAGDEVPAGQPAYGVSLVSRLSVREWRIVRLPAAPMRAPVMVQGPPRRVLLLVDDEPRIGLAAVVEAPFGLVTVVCTHLTFVPGWNIRQLLMLRRAVADLPRPRVLMGDLNMPGRLPSVVTRWSPAGRAPTYPSTGPRVQLDHILIEPGTIGCETAGSLAMGLSDHCALYADLAPTPHHAANLVARSPNQRPRRLGS